MSEPANSLVGLLNYNPEAQLLEEATALRLRMTSVIGEVKARALWLKAGKVRRGRIKGQKLYDLAALINLYGAIIASEKAAGKTREEVVRGIAEYAHATARLQFGATEGGIAASLKRALKERDERDAAMRAALAKIQPHGGLFNLGRQSMDTTRRNALARALMAPDTKSGGLLYGEHEIDGK